MLLLRLVKELIIKEKRKNDEDDDFGVHSFTHQNYCTT